MLEVERLEVGYGEARALDDVSLEVGTGELVCVVGPNGAGKSTLINTLAGLLRVRSGALRFDGADLSTLAPHRFVGAGIAVVPEGRRLFGGLTVRENLELGSLLPAARRQRRAPRRQGRRPVGCRVPRETCTAWASAGRDSTTRPSWPADSPRACRPDRPDPTATRDPSGPRDRRTPPPGGRRR